MSIVSDLIFLFYLKSIRLWVLDATISAICNIREWQSANWVTRVDVSETFTANQLWFRILSGLFQRFSLPENLWTALIQLWTALKTEIFRAKNHRWNNAVSALIFSETELISAKTGLNFSVLNSADSEKIRADQYWNRADQRWCLSCSLNQRWKTSKLWNSAVQRWLPLGLQPG